MDSPEIKFVPFTVSVKPELPASAEVGDIEVVVGVRGVPVIIILSILTVFAFPTANLSLINDLSPYELPSEAFDFDVQESLFNDKLIPVVDIDVPPVASPLRVQVEPVLLAYPSNVIDKSVYPVVVKVKSKYRVPLDIAAIAAAFPVLGFPLKYWRVAPEAVKVGLIPLNDVTFVAPVVPDPSKV